MQRPSRVRVLGKQFAIKFCPEGSDEMEGNLGMCSYDKQIVYVEEGMPLENEQSTVFHELIHAVEEMMQLGLSEEHVKGLEVGLFALLRDNPSFVKYLMAKK